MPGRLRVEVAGRLVGEEQARRVDDGAGDRHALLLAAGKLRRPVRRPLVDAEIFEQLQRALLRLAAAEGRRSSAAARGSPAPRIPAADDGTDRRSRSAGAGAPCARRRRASTPSRRRSGPRRHRDARAARRCGGASTSRRPTARRAPPSRRPRRRGSRPSGRRAARSRSCRRARRLRAPARFSAPRPSAPSGEAPGFRPSTSRAALFAHS